MLHRDRRRQRHQDGGIVSCRRKAVALAKAAYRRYWLHGCATSDAAVALDAAASVGYDREAVLKGVQKSEIKDRLVLENEEAIRRGVFGSPFFFVDGERFWGSDRISMLVPDPRSEAEARPRCPLK
jgi:2-hydroxychromene-2-carboxylate isomerase